MLVWWAIFYLLGIFLVPSFFTVAIIQTLILILYLSSYFHRNVPSDKYGVCPKSFSLTLVNRFFLICVTSLILFMSGMGGNQEDDGPFIFKKKAIPDSMRYQASQPHYLSDIERICLKPVEFLRKKSLEQISKGPISSNTQDMLKALLLAERRGLSYDLRDSYSYLGIAHFLALSGLHLGLIVIPISVFLSWFGLSRRLKEVIVLLFVIAYTAIANFPSSLLRASALYLAISFYRIINIRANLINSLILGSFSLVIIKRELIFDIGFELSFLAVAGIACLAIPVFNKIGGIILESRGSKIIKFIVYPLIITISVNLFTLPLVLFVFKRSPLISPLINLLMILPVTLFLYAGFAYLLIPVALIHGILSIPLNLLSKVLYRVPMGLAGNYYPAIYPTDIEFKSYIAAIILVSVCAAIGLQWKEYFLRVCAIGLISFSIIAGLISGNDMAQFKTKEENRYNGKWWWNNNKYYLEGGGVLSIKNGMGRFEARRIISELYEGGKGKVSNIIIISSDVWNVSGIVLLINRLGVKKIICSRYLVMSERDIFNKYGIDTALLEVVARGDILKLDGATMKILSPRYPPPRGDRIEFDGSILRFNLYPDAEKNTRLKNLRINFMETIGMFYY